MSKSEKRLQKARQNGKNISIIELQELLKDYGIILHRVSGSHHIFRYNLLGQIRIMSIPINNPIKVVYVKKALAIIDRIRNEVKEK